MLIVASLRSATVIADHSRSGRRGTKVSFQLTVLKVLAGQTAGRCSVALIRQAVEILMTSGKDWSDRMKRLAEHAPDLNIFSAKFVLRGADGWEITQEGRRFLAALETAAAVRKVPIQSLGSTSNEPLTRSAIETAGSVDLVPRRRDRPRRRRRRDRPSRRTA